MTVTHRPLLCALATTLLPAAPLPKVCAEPNPVPLRERIGFDQRLGSPLPLDAQLITADGRIVALGDTIRKRPAVLVFGYFSCPQLCGVTQDGILDALRQLRPTVGRDYDFVYVSIDPADTPELARQQKAAAVRRYGREAGSATEGWHFLTADRSTIARVTTAAGFRFQPVPNTGEFAHPSGFVVVRPDGVIAQYFLGVDFRPAEVARALGDAADGRTGRRVFDLLLACLSGGLRAGVSRWAFLTVQIASGLSVVVLAACIVRMLRAERRARRAGTLQGAGTASSPAMRKEGAP